MNKKAKFILCFLLLILVSSTLYFFFNIKNTKPNNNNVNSNKIKLYIYYKNKQYFTPLQYNKNNDTTLLNLLLDNSNEIELKKYSNYYKLSGFYLNLQDHKTYINCLDTNFESYGYNLDTKNYDTITKDNTPSSSLNIDIFLKAFKLLEYGISETTITNSNNEFLFLPIT